MPDRDRQRTDRRPQGDRTQTGGKPPVVTFVSVDYNPRTEMLSSAVYVTRNEKPAPNERVSFLVDDEQIDYVVTDGMGKAKVQQKRTLSLGAHKVGVQVPALGLSMNEVFIVSSVATPGVHTPELIVTSTYTAKGDAFQVVLSAQVNQRGGPLPQCEVHFKSVALDVVEFTNHKGEARKLIFVPNPTRATKQAYEVHISLPDYGVSENVVLQLEREPDKLPTQLTIMRPTEVAPNTGVYTLVVNAEHRADEHAQAHVLKGARVTVVGGNRVLHELTDEYGQATLTLRCTEGETFTPFQLDVPGIEEMHEFNLMGKRTFRTGKLRQIIGGTLVVSTFLAILNVLGVIMHAFWHVLMVVQAGLRAQDAPVYGLGTYAWTSSIVLVALFLATLIVLAILFGSNIKTAWDRARWMYYFRRASTVLKKNEPSVFHRAINRMLPKTVAATPASVAQATQTVTNTEQQTTAATQPTVQQPVVAQAAPAAPRVSDHLSMTNLAQWGSIVALLLNEILIEGRKS